MSVRRRAAIIGTLAILLTAATAGRLPVVGRAVSQVRSIQRNFGDLKKVDSMNSLERFVFSVALSRSKAPAEAINPSTPPVGRT